MDLPSLLTEEQISKFTTELGLTKEQIIEFKAEFKAYDTDGDGNITCIDLGLVNKVRHLSYLFIVLSFGHFHNNSFFNIMLLGFWRKYYR